MNGLTRKQILEKTGCPYYLLSHLRLTGRVPVIREPKGRGDSVIYAPEAVQVVRKYLTERGLYAKTAS